MAEVGADGQNGAASSNKPSSSKSSDISIEELAAPEIDEVAPEVDEVTLELEATIATDEDAQAPDRSAAIDSAAPESKGDSGDPDMTGDGDGPPAAVEGEVGPEPPPPSAAPPTAVRAEAAAGAEEPQALRPAEIKKDPEDDEDVEEIGREDDVVKNVVVVEDDDDEDDEDEDFEDETLVERLIGLTEMFPEGLTSGLVAAAKGGLSGVKWVYSSGRSLTWVLFSTATVLFLPIMIETERMGIEEAQKQQQRQILLGPSSAVSAGQNAPLPSV